MKKRYPLPQSLQALIDALAQLPGVGVRSAQRMAYHLLQHNQEGAHALSHALDHALTHLKPCQACNSFTEHDLCHVCGNEHRDPSLLCVVESPADMQMIESSQTYSGLYYVLMGKLSPLEGIGPSALGFNRFVERVTDGRVTEVILATSFTAEGETTAHYLSQAIQHTGIKITRLARGAPIGSELEYLDAGTVAWALMDRR